MMPGQGSYPTIERKGMMLMERPEVLTKEDRAEEARKLLEWGFKGFEATVWYGLMGPGKMPRAMAQRMNDDINKVIAYINSLQ